MTDLAKLDAAATRILSDACLWRRHDFGLMSDEDKSGVIFDCLEWYRALLKSGALIDPTDDAAIARAGLVRLSALGYRGAG